ncbi:MULTISPECIES: hypothetical protein [Pseudomonas]|uniref:Flagellar basal body rod FlgEFG protein C-terminal n=1 Tax=Pseudomonas segetis TaxID=298908 RepID=A0A239JFA8_9PSED|nr:MULTISPECIES: hypothetical protein [Pseudomonas]SNT04510.1 hypothetical protein SAMN05216255_4327 [Pseudomonas segetis]
MNAITGSAFNAGLATVQSGQQRLERAAQTIASGAAPDAAQAGSPEITDQLIELRVGQYHAQAGARLLETADEVLGTLIDTRA